jgi:hypothetical protein
MCRPPVLSLVDRIEHSSYGTTGGRIAWLYVDEACWVRILSFLFAPLLSLQKPQLMLRSEWIDLTTFEGFRPANAALEPRWHIRSQGS